MNDLEQYFRSNKGRLITKWDHYFKIYDRYFSRFRGADVHLLEIGVCHGGSLQMWKHYFGKSARIYGVDIHPRTLAFTEEQVKIFIGDQEDRAFLGELKDAIPRIDILIDDGGHTMAQQINTFEELFPAVAENGIYICEDTHTSYWSSFGGGYRKSGTFIEYIKDKIDELNAFHNTEISEQLQPTPFTRSAYAIHCYDSMVVVEKRVRPYPVAEHTGRMRLPRHHPQR
ncbi:MAG: hypothetical protein ACJAYC_002451 [Halieaceae bacterium]|jgi:hypothetical protein